MASMGDFLTAAFIAVSPAGGKRLALRRITA
jgi:hypothetical protein